MWKTHVVAGDDILKNMDTIADNARKKAADPDVYVPSNDGWSNPNAVRRATRERDVVAEKYYKLSKEPLVAAVHVETEAGEERVYFFSRQIQAPDMGEGYYTHTMAPIGKLATYDPGDVYTFNDTLDLKVISKVIITPKQNGNTWDSAPAQFFWKDDMPFRLASLLKFLQRKPRAVPVEPDIARPISELPSIEGIIDLDLEALDDEVDFDTDYISGDDRDILRGTGLRDQAILDKVQDNIFRLPLGSQIMISGPPGSGKTTTLVRRLAQKSDPEFLTESELETVIAATHPDLPHERSWILFTPSELLESYLAETFNREGIAAPKERIWTWEKYSLTVARENTSILSRPGNSKGLLLDKKALHLRKDIAAAPFDWVRSIEAWMSQRFYNDLDSSLIHIANEKDQSLVQFAQQLRGRIQKRGATDLFNSMASIVSEASETQRFVKQLNFDLNKMIVGRLSNLLRNRKYDQQEYNRLRENASSAERSNADVEELRLFVKRAEFTEKESSELRERIAVAIAKPSSFEDKRKLSKRDIIPSELEVIKSLIKIILNYANSYDNQTGSSRTSARTLSLATSTNSSQASSEKIYGKLVDIFDRELFEPAEFEDIRNKNKIIESLSKIANAPENYFTQIATRYREFRNKNKQTFYIEGGFDAQAIDPIELDALLLIALKNANDLILKKPSDNTKWGFLKKYESILRNQVLVDEASDFSALQLSVMFQIAHPLVKSFCASGDFDQGLTLAGVANFQELKSAISTIKEHSLAVGYRQSAQLAEFTFNFGQQNLKLSSRFQNPDFGQISGVPPAFFQADGDLSKQSHWIASRIQEIEALSPELPSIAILVPHSSMVKKLETELRQIIYNIPITGYEEPGNLGRDQEVRIFPVQYVKGLEFESAIFAGVDILKSNEPELFAKYLYVGSTRAATFLAVTAHEQLPSELAKLTHVSSWLTQ